MLRRWGIVTVLGACLLTGTAGSEAGDSLPPADEEAPPKGKDSKEPTFRGQTTEQ